MSTVKNTYIVTGANGFLGNNIIRKLTTKSENEIRALVLPNDKIKSLEGLNCKIFYGDVTKKETLNDIFDVDVDTNLYVIHCAAIVYIKTKKNSKVYNVNVNGTKNIIDKVLEKKAKLVYVNSVHAIWEKPNNEIMEEIYDFGAGHYGSKKNPMVSLICPPISKESKSIWVERSAYIRSFIHDKSAFRLPRQHLQEPNG